MKQWIYIVIILIIVAYMSREPIKEVVTDVYETLTRKQFISKYSNVVKEASKNTGLFPSVFMAQAILESGNGNSKLTREANNFFGIKADKSWTGPVYEIKTKEFIDGKEVYEVAKFRKYSTPLLSFLDRVMFLIDNKRYANNGVFNSITPEDQARALQKAGYATDPNYANLLITLINQNNLKDLDV